MIEKILCFFGFHKLVPGMTVWENWVNYGAQVCKRCAWSPDMNPLIPKRLRWPKTHHAEKKK